MRSRADSTTIVLEAGASAGAAVQRVGPHPALLAVVRAGRPGGCRPPRRLRLAGARPRTAYPTGDEWVAGYLQPLADALEKTDEVEVRYGHRVVGVTRFGRDRLVDSGREDEPLVLQVDTGHGIERITASAVVDASGTWGGPNPLGRRRPARTRRDRPRRPDQLPRPRPAQRAGQGEVRRQARRRRRHRGLRPERARRARPPRRDRTRHPGHLAGPSAERRQRLRRRRQRPARGPRRARQVRRARGEAAEPSSLVTVVPLGVGRAAGRRPPDRDRLRRPDRDRRRRDRRRHRVPPRPRLPVRGPARPRPGPAVAPRPSRR